MPTSISADFIAHIVYTLWKNNSTSSLHHNRPMTPPTSPNIPAIDDCSYLETPQDVASYTFFVSYINQLLLCPTMSDQAIVLCLIYISRLRELNLHEDVKQGSERDLFSTSLLVALKMLDDNRTDNAAWVYYCNRTLPTVTVRLLFSLFVIQQNSYINHHYLLLIEHGKRVLGKTRV
jgi:hypothetical protein